MTYSNNLSWSSPARLPEMPRSDVWARMWNKISDYDSPGSYYFNEKFMKLWMRTLLTRNIIRQFWSIRKEYSIPAILPQLRGGPMSETQTGWMSSIESLLLCNSIMPVFQVAQNATTIMLLSVIKTSPVFFVMAMIRTNVFNLSFNFDTKITDWLDMSFSTRMSNIKNDEPYMDNGGSDAVTWYYEVYRMYPTLSVFLPNGDLQVFI